MKKLGNISQPSDFMKIYVSDVMSVYLVSVVSMSVVDYDIKSLNESESAIIEESLLYIQTISGGIAR